MFGAGRRFTLHQDFLALTRQASDISLGIILFYDELPYLHPNLGPTAFVYYPEVIRWELFSFVVFFNFLFKAFISLFFFGGDNRTRTGGLLLARQTFSPAELYPRYSGLYRI